MIHQPLTRILSNINDSLKGSRDERVPTRTVLELEAHDELS